MVKITRSATARKLAFADKLRAHPTRFEQKLWNTLRRGVRGLQFSSQVVIRGYIVDFYCAKVRLALELDGRGHDQQHDSSRDAHLFQAGVTVMRFPNPITQVDVNNIVNTVWCECRYRLGRDISTYPPRSSSQLEKPPELPGTEKIKTCGNVEKPKGCQRQVFATAEVAEGTALALRSLGIEASVVRCGKCKLIHLTETRAEKSAESKAS